MYINLRSTSPAEDKTRQDRTSQQKAHPLSTKQQNIVNLQFIK